MTSSMPSSSASGCTRSNGEVVARTTGRPASWCWSMSDPGVGLHLVDQPLGRRLPARACTAARFQPLATRAAWRVSSIAGRVSPTMSKTL